MLLGSCGQCQLQFPSSSPFWYFEQRHYDHNNVSLQFVFLNHNAKCKVSEIQYCSYIKRCDPQLQITVNECYWSGLLVVMQAWSSLVCLFSKIKSWGRFVRGLISSKSEIILTNCPNVCSIIFSQLHKFEEIPSNGEKLVKKPKNLITRSKKIDPRKW